MIVVVERMGADRVAEIDSGSRRVLLPTSLRSADQIAVDARLRWPRSPAPYCTVLTCMSYQFAQNVERMPP